MTVRLSKIVSGGQTGVDQGALDAALTLNFPHGGWCPKGRRSEAGPIPDRFSLQPTDATNYAVRTRWNVRDSDATLVLCVGEPSGGTAMTIELSRQAGKPLTIANPAIQEDIAKVARWVNESGVAVLNVAGPRESESPGIQVGAKFFVETLLRTLGV